MLKYSLTVLSLTAAVAVAPAAAAQGSFELFGGQFLVDSEVSSDSRLDVLGLRAGWSFAPRWAVEGSVSRIDEGPLELHLGDLSLRWTRRPEDRFRFYVLGGPGMLTADIAGVPGGGQPDDELTAHLGTGVEIGLGERWTLRPDVRLRWFDDGTDDIHTEATVGLGVRF